MFISAKSNLFNLIFSILLLSMTTVSQVNADVFYTLSTGQFTVNNSTGGVPNTWRFLGQFSISNANAVTGTVVNKTNVTSFNGTLYNLTDNTHFDFNASHWNPVGNANVQFQYTVGNALMSSFFIEQGADGNIMVGTDWGLAYQPTIPREIASNPGNWFFINNANAFALAVVPGPIPVPEPHTYVLLGASLLTGICLRKKLMAKRTS